MPKLLANAMLEKALAARKANRKRLLDREWVEVFDAIDRAADNGETRVEWNAPLDPETIARLEREGFRVPEGTEGRVVHIFFGGEGHKP